MRSQLHFKGEEYESRRKEKQKVGDISGLGHKTCYMSLNPNIAYYIVLEYLKRTKDFINNSSNYRDIAFADLRLFDEKSNENKFRKYISNNYFNHYDLVSKDINSLHQISGYESVVLCNYTNLPSIASIWDYKQVDAVIHKLLETNNKMYYLMPDLIFAADNDRVYDTEAQSNTKINYREFALFRHFDLYFQYLRDFYKYPLYRIVVPNYNSPYYPNDVLTMRIPRAAEQKRRRDNLEFFKYLQRGFLFTDKVAEALYLIHLDNQPQNYNIGSDIHYSYWQVYAEQGKKQTENMKRIKLDNSFLDSKGFVNYSKEYYDKMLNKLSKVWFTYGDQ